MKNDKMKTKLESIVGSKNVREEVSPYSSEVADRMAYSYEMISHLTREFVPDYVVMPGSLEEVQEIVRSANEFDEFIAVYSRGTNVYGYTLAKEGGIMIDLHRMDRILEVNDETMTATVEPGVTWGRLRKEALKKNLMIIPILGPHTGGPVGNYNVWNMSTASTRYSPDRIITLEAVLPNGEILRTGSQALMGNEKANPYYRHAFGPDITGLFRGSLGSFGIITKAVVKLYPILDGMKNLTYGFQDLQTGLDAMQAIEKLDITKHIAIYSREWPAEICNLEFKHLRDPGEQKKVLEKYPPWILNIGICGKKRQVEFYEELIGDETEDGSEFEFEAGEELEHWKDLVQGAGHRIPTMFGSARNAMSVILISPLNTCDKVYNTALRKTSESDFRDPITGEPYTPMTFFYPTERCRNMYCEIEFRYDAAKPESVQKAAELWQEVSLYYHKELGAALMIITPMLEDMISPTYIEILKGIKNVFDPKGILSRGNLLQGVPLLTKGAK